MSDAKTGNRIWLLGEDGLFYFYCHLSCIFCHTGMTVTPDTIIGRLGNTGTTYPSGIGIHLHFEIRYNMLLRESAINPIHILNGYKFKK